MIVAPLLVYRYGEKRLWGNFQFAQLPAPNDKISITDYRGRVQNLQIMFINHEPLLEGVDGDPEKEVAWVHAQWTDEFY